MEYLEITGLIANTQIGVYEWEKAIKQKLLIDLSFIIKTPKKDLISETVDYAQVASRILEKIEGQGYGLIETVAREIADILKNEFKLKQFKIKVSKPKALKMAQNVAVTLIEKEPQSIDF